MERPDSMDRKTSFNPEAVVFSPTTASVKMAEESTTAASSRISALPRKDAPLARNKSAHTQLEGAKSVPQQVTVGDLLSMGVPMDVLAKTLSECETQSTRELTGMSPNTKILGQHTTGFPVPSLDHFMFPSQRTEPNFNTVDVDELSASLGLPSAKKDSMANQSPARSHKSRTSQGASNELYGKLIGTALNKPLTADSLAHYMKSWSDSSEDTIKAYQDSQDPSNTSDYHSQEQGQAVKVVRPPPGFVNQMPRMVTVEDQRTSIDPAATMQKVGPPALLAYFQPYPNMAQSTIPLQPQHHTRLNPRRRERRHTRTKRTDQGPEPSAADIYPDDAHWTPPQYTQQNYFAPRPCVPLQPQPVVRKEDATSWPTPAEVYKHEPQPPAPAHRPQDFNIFEAHTTPTADDLSAADGEVLSLLDELPEPTIQTLINFGAFDLLPEDRPLSPGQITGKRYGVNFYGIGLGDSWQPPKVQELDPFRVRPCDHSGWGGWEWAIKKGWVADA